MSLKLRTRLLKMIPGTILWGSIVLIFILSFTIPIVVIYLVIFYILYFIYQALNIMYLVYKANKRIDQVKKINWEEKLNTEFKDIWKEYYEILLIPVANESKDIIDPTIQATNNIIYPNDKKIILFATEKKFPNGKEIGEEYKKEIKDKYYDFIITEHTVIEGEIPGKASNENFAARELYKIFKERGLDPKKAIITSSDADYRHNKNYFLYLTYTYLSEENRDKTIYQPIPIFYNNIWKVPIASRIIATFSAQWQMALTFKPERLMNFSCYAINFESLKKSGFWDPDVIPEDERLYWKATLQFGNDTKVIPLFVPVYGDAVLAETYWKSLKEQYKQLRRWAWGASEMAFSIPNVMKNKKISRYRKFTLIFQQIRNSFERAIAPIIITFGDLIPELNYHYQKTTLSYTIPTIVSRFLTITTILVIVILIFELKMAPEKTHKNPLNNAFSYLTWITYPIVSIIFSAIPAIDAQTRLLIGRDITYTPTIKKT